MFTEPFRTVDYDALAYLKAHVKTCVRLYRQHKSSEPCTTMCQSSGMGKTRLALQLASLEHMNVIYICCRGETPGYPPATDWIASLIKYNGLDYALWQPLFSAIMTEYCQVPSILEDQTVRRAWLQHAVVNDTEGSAFWQQVRHRFDALRSTKRAGDIPKMAAYSPAHFVFVFDECANFAKEEYAMCSVSRTVSTVSTMSHIRSALREIHSSYSCNLLGLFIDTDAAICQLTPPPDRPVVLSPSFCEADMPKPQLAFPPVGMLPMCNLEKTDSMMTHTLHYAPLGRGIDDDTDTGVKVLFCPETLVLLSRPMFAMHVHRRTVDTMVPIANYKLLNGIDITKPYP